MILLNQTALVVFLLIILYLQESKPRKRVVLPTCQRSLSWEEGVLGSSPTWMLIGFCSFSSASWSRAPCFLEGSSSSTPPQLLSTCNQHCHFQGDPHPALA